MLNLGDAREAVMGLGDKTMGLVFEAVGTITGNERLKERGRTRQEAGTERLDALAEEVKASARETEARAEERRQQMHQPADKRTDSNRHASMGRGGVEKVKGATKQAVGTITGNEDLKAEGEAQSDKASAQTQAGKHEARAEVHRANAEKKEERERRLAR